jgi:HK97 family phage prohead protease
MDLLQADFTLDALADIGAKAVEDDSGDLIIEGLASDVGLDREDEAFEPGAFSKGIDAFLAGTAPLLYHHHNDQQLGTVTELVPTDTGLNFKAVVARPPESSPLFHVYTLIKRGMMNAVSVRGRFKKAVSGTKTLISEADIFELSVTPLAVNPRTLFEVTSKAFAVDVPSPVQVTDAEINAWFEERFARIEAAQAKLSQRPVV